MTGSKYEEKIIEPAPMPSTDFLNMAAKYSASQAIANLDIDKDVALDYAYAHNDKTAMTGPLPGSFWWISQKNTRYIKTKSASFI